MKQRPALVGAGVFGFLVMIAVAAWLVAFLNRPPGCIEYRSLNCAAIVLEREPQTASRGGQEGSTNSDEIESFTYQQAEVLDWLRLLAMSRREDGSISVATLIENSMADANRVRSCYDLVDCLSVAKTGDIDYDGLSGQAGTTAAGLGRTVRLTSSSQAEPVNSIWGRIPAGLPAPLGAAGSFNEIHLITNLREQRSALLQVAKQIRTELREAGISLRVRVLPEAHSRSSSLSTARIILAPDVRSLRRDGVAVSLELQSPERDIVWRASFSATLAHVVDAARRGVSPDQKSIVVVDCLQHAVTEAVDSNSGVTAVEVVCFGSARLQEVINASNAGVRWLLISSQREVEIVTVLVAAIESPPLLVLRL
jgi:hypothetical protein